MKQKLKLIMYLALAAVVFSCAEERDFVKEQNHRPNVDFKEVSFKEALSIPIFKNAYQKVAKSKSDFGGAEQARTALEEQFGFTIVESSPVRIITDQHGVIFYIMLVERVIKEELVFENLMIRVKDAETAAAIFKYLLSEKGIKTETEEYFFKEVVISEIIDLNVEGRMFFSTNSDGDTCITTTQLMCNATWSGEPYNHLASFNCFVHAANFGLSSLYETSSSECFPIGGGGNSSSNGSSSGSSNNTGGLGASVGTASDPLEMLAIPCRTGNCIEADIIEKPCTKLGKLADTLFQNIKPDIDFLKTKVIANTPVEWGVDFKKDGPSSSLSINDSSFTYQNFQIQGTSDNTPMIYGQGWVGGAHCHTINGFGMFSWKDIQNLLLAFNGANSNIKTNVTIIIVVPNAANPTNPKVYAIKVDNIATLTAKLNADLVNPNFADSTETETIDNIHADMELSWRNSTNLEKSFLEKFGDYGISLYKPTSDALTNWSKLKLSPNTLDGSGVEQVPCIFQ